jgi:hypothetical protein
MKVFISYSKTDKKIAASIKAEFEELKLPAFLAHEDLQVSEEWLEEIIKELNRCEIFVALLSKAFKASEWCAQELGFIATRKDVLVIPLSLDDTVAYGFIAKLQSRRIHTTDDLPILIRDVLLKKRPRLAIPLWIKKVKEAGSYRSAEATVEPLVPHFEKFTKEEIEAFLKAALDNNQVWDASKCRLEYLPTLARERWEDISAPTWKKLKSKLQVTTDELRGTAA